MKYIDEIFKLFIDLEGCSCKDYRLELKDLFKDELDEEDWLFDDEL